MVKQILTHLSKLLIYISGICCKQMEMDAILTELFGFLLFTEHWYQWKHSWLKMLLLLCWSNASGFIIIMMFYFW